MKKAVGLLSLLWVVLSAVPGYAQDTQPLYMTTMTHMESNFQDDRDQKIFERHVRLLSYGMSLAEEYGAKLTVESEKSFARANTIWGVNFMQTILDRGHGVGTHCDFGFRDPLMPVEEYAALFQQNKALVDALVGSENNLGCSGAGSVNDYVQAGSLAGFKYLDGIVSMHYLSMPLENRPSAQWTNRYIMSGHHHENAPLELTERIYPFMAADAQDFQADANGAMLISAGDLGSLIRYAESSVGDDCQDRCVLTHEDVDFLVATLREIDGFRDRNRFAKVSIYLEVTLFNPKNEDSMRYFFAQMQQLSDEGIIEWATQMDVYRAFVGTANT